MCEILGKLGEIEEISIDKFSGADNLESTAYFLSHCHSDHTKGLDSEEFRDALLKRDNVFLYVSEISCCILKNDTRYEHLKGKIKALTTAQPYILTIPSFNGAAQKEICVTLIPAGHCPGSVMFLFEMLEGNVLYTGDFRVTMEDVRQFHQLHHSDGTPKEINACYLDATFFDELYSSFPTRDESLMKICELTREWLSENNSNEVRLVTSAYYGYEHVYVGIKDILGMKIHVRDHIYRKLRNVPKIESVITCNGEETRVHAFSQNECYVYHKNGVKWKTLRLSCLWYQREHAFKEEMVQLCPKYTRICYACHCSHSELVDFIKYFLPRKVVVFAFPPGKSARQVEKEIYDILRPKKRESVVLNGVDDVIVLKMQSKRRLLSGQQSHIQSLINVSQLQLSEEMWSISSHSGTEGKDSAEVVLDSDHSIPKTAVKNGCDGSMLQGSDERSQAVPISCGTTHSLQENENFELMLSSDSEDSPSILPQCNMTAVDPQSFFDEKSTPKKQIEVITLSSDDSL